MADQMSRNMKLNFEPLRPAAKVFKPTQSSSSASLYAVGYEFNVDKETYTIFQNGSKQIDTHSLNPTGSAGFHKNIMARQELRPMNGQVGLGIEQYFTNLGFGGSGRPTISQPRPATHMGMALVPLAGCYNSPTMTDESGEGKMYRNLDDNMMGPYGYPNGFRAASNQPFPGDISSMKIKQASAPLVSSAVMHQNAMDVMKNPNNTQAELEHAAKVLDQYYSDPMLKICTDVKKQQRDALAQMGPGAIKRFTPSYSVLQNMGYSPHSKLLAGPFLSEIFGTSPNYLGDATLSRNRSANIQNCENCSLFVMGLHPDTTYTDLLGSIRGCGKIYATVINPPTGQHPTSAAKIVFQTREGAERLVWLFNNGEFWVKGCEVLKTYWNKIKVAKFPHPEQSRAIRISGPREMMNFNFFELFFHDRFTYSLDRRGEVPCDIPGWVSHEWHFGSLRCQAASAKQAIERELFNSFLVEWAADPCEGPDQPFFYGMN